MALAKEREAAAEKLALLDAARERLSETFQALSAKALQGNNQAFLELARAKLEQFQVAARGDLETAIRYYRLSNWSEARAMADELERQLDP